MSNQTDDSYTVIPKYSKYAIHPDGTVKRVSVVSRGRYANKVNYVVQPVIHPKGYLWCVQLTGDDGVRKRIPIKKLLAQVFGHAELTNN